MIRNVQRTWFEVWGTEQAQNRFLKGLLLLFLCLSTLETIGLVTLSLRQPALIAVTPSQTQVLAVAPPNEELLASELKRAATAYVLARHNWDWNTIEKSHGDAARYVESGFAKEFQQANASQVKAAKDKKVSQKFYISDLKIDPKAKTAQVTGDRILVVEGLRATNAMALEIVFDYGARTPSNPEGIYITAEKLLK